MTENQGSGQKTTDRRDFLRKAALVTAGLAVGVGVSGCKDEKEETPLPEAVTPIVPETAGLPEDEKDILLKAIKDQLKESNSPVADDFIRVDDFSLSHPGQEYTQQVKTMESGNKLSKGGLTLRSLPVVGEETAICYVEEGAWFRGIKYKVVVQDNVLGYTEWLMIDVNTLFDNPYIKLPGGYETIKAAGYGVNGYIFLCYKEGEWTYTKEFNNNP